MIHVTALSFVGNSYSISHNHVAVSIVFTKHAGPIEFKNQSSRIDTCSGLRRAHSAIEGRIRGEIVPLYFAGRIDHIDAVEASRGTPMRHAA